MLAILAVIMAFGLCACGNDGGNPLSDNPTTQATTDEFVTSGKQSIYAERSTFVI